MLLEFAIGVVEDLVVVIVVVASTSALTRASPNCASWPDWSSGALVVVCGNFVCFSRGMYGCFACFSKGLNRSLLFACIIKGNVFAFSGSLLCVAMRL